MKERLLFRIRMLLVFFMISLFLSGLTAIPVAEELRWLIRLLPADAAVTVLFQKVLIAYTEVQTHAHFLLYGYDWLAFAHFVLAILFIGPYKDPVRNIWVIQFGQIACVLVLPFALLAGYFRGLPLWWRLGDCLFGVVGYYVLHHCRNYITQLQVFYTQTFPNNKIYTS